MLEFVNNNRYLTAFVLAGVLAITAFHGGGKENLETNAHSLSNVRAAQLAELGL